MVGFLLLIECQPQKLLNFLRGLVLILGEGGSVPSAIFVYEVIFFVIDVGVVAHPIEVHLAVHDLRCEAARGHVQKVVEF